MAILPIYVCLYDINAVVKLYTALCILQSMCWVCVTFRLDAFLQCHGLGAPHGQCISVASVNLFDNISF